MPLENKYELRSQEVQEVLSAPPRFLTLWGNLLVTCVLIIGIVFLGQYKIIRTLKIPVLITETKGEIRLLIDSAFVDQVKVNQKLKLQLNNDIVADESIAKILDTTIDMGRKKVLVLTKIPSKKISNKLASRTSVSGEAEIQVDKVTLLHVFVSK